MSDQQIVTETQRVGIRRAPKFGVFIGAGAVLGALGALIATYSMPQPTALELAADPTLPTTDQVLGYLLVWGLALGIAAGALGAVVADRVLRRRVIQVDVQRDLVHTPAAGTQPADPQPADPEPRPGADPDPDQPGELPADPDLTPQPPNERGR